MQNNNYVAIMAGGIGSRFWPASRENRPKQFLDILGTGKTLIQETFDRFTEIVPPENIYIVTNQIYSETVAEQLPTLPPENIVAEPNRRNTAPCIAYVAYKIAKRDPNANMVVAPSDHLILDRTSFKKDIETGLSFVNSLDVLLTLGIRPNRPDTNYGYIQYEEPEISSGVHPVKTFTEKPNVELAQHFLESGDYLWNSGMFLWNVQSILKAIKTHLPDVAFVFDEGIDVYNTEKELEFINRAYSMCKNVSIDYGVMEKANNVNVIPSDFGWSDLGTWNSLWDTKEKDYIKNAVDGEKVMVYDSDNNMIKVPKEKLVVLHGLSGYCIVDTDDVLVIYKRDEEKRIKEFMRDVKARIEKGEDFL